MKIAGIYSFNNGEKEVARRYPKLLNEVKASINAVNAVDHKSKISKEKTMLGKVLFKPASINKSFKAEFGERGWNSIRVSCEYSPAHYLQDYATRPNHRGAFREMDFIKDRLGVEVQFGKYAFMVYNVCAKMTIFHNLGHIDCGIEIVPVKAFANEMSTGVSYFEQFIWDLENRGVSDIDIPVMIIGIDA
jgi:Restriction endonuclease BglII